MSEYRVIEGNCLSVLATLDAESVQTCITSPPYYGLRDYGHDGQIGLEESPQEYVEKLVDVFREVRRVLRDDGTLWLNLGDSYAGSGKGPSNSYDRPAQHLSNVASAPNRWLSIPDGVKGKDLLGIPWMVAFALRADGWYLRSDIIWAKPNPMPESVTDRPTKAHEYLFLLTKSGRYYYDAAAIAEEANNEAKPAGVYQLDPRSGRNEAGSATNLGAAVERRNKRSVWLVGTTPFPGAHFATFPPKLIEPCVLAGSSPQACAECGAPWERVTERTAMVVRPSERVQTRDQDEARTATSGTMTQAPTSQTVGWEATCSCDDAGTARCTVLDPFNGAGTTGIVALRNDRNYIGIELNPDYAQMSRDRIYDDGPLLNVEKAA